MRLIAALLAALAFLPAFADEQAVTYLEHEGRVIELTAVEFDLATGIPGAMMAVESDELASRENYGRLNNSDMAVRAWVREGEWCVIHYIPEGTVKRFPLSEIKTRLIDRPWIENESRSRPAGA